MHLKKNPKPSKESFFTEWQNITKRLSSPSINPKSIDSAQFFIASTLYPLESNAWLKLGLSIKIPYHQEIKEKCFDMAISLDENNADAWLHLGNIIQLKKTPESFQKSEVCYRKALEINPKIQGGWYNLAQIIEDREEKIIYYKKEIANFPDFLIPYQDLIELLKDDKEIKYYQKKKLEILARKKERNAQQP